MPEDGRRLLEELGSLNSDGGHLETGIVHYPGNGTSNHKVTRTVEMEQLLVRAWPTLCGERETRLVKFTSDAAE